MTAQNKAGDSFENHLAHVTARQPDFGYWLAQLGELAYKPKVSHQEFRIFGAGLVLEAADEDQLLLWLQKTCEFLDIPFQVLDFSDNGESLERISQMPLTLGVSFLQTGDWLISANPDTEAANARTAVLEILKNDSSRALFVTYSRAYPDIAECYRHKGRFDRHMRWAEPKPEIAAADFINDTGHKHFGRELLAEPTRLGRLLCMDFRTSRRQGILGMALKRKHHETGKKIAWADVVQIAVNGTGKGALHAESGLQRHIAVHESGHAVACIHASKGQCLPEYVSLMPNRFSYGQVAEGIDWVYMRDRTQTLHDFLWRIKIYLAGRVAEELVFNASGVGVCSADEDLQSASEMAYQLVARNGFHSEYQDGVDLGRNLFVPDDDVSEAFKAVVVQEARQLLTRLYGEIKQTLTSDLPLLLALSDALLENKFLFREDVACVLEHFKDKRSYALCQ